jgi:hypothetical protein
MNPMNKRIGLWFNEQKAVIVSVSEDGEERKTIASYMENYTRFSSITPGDGAPEDARDKRYWNHLGEYYDKVIAHIRDAESIQIFGPGEAKHELKKRLEGAGLAEYTLTIEDSDKLTDQQVAKKVRERFPARSQFDIS